MRVLIAILFSVLLIGNPTISTATLLCSGPKACAKCVCNTCCCVNQSAQDSQSVPVESTSTTTQSDFQIVAQFVGQLVVPIQNISRLPNSATVDPSVLTSTTPIFQRNCAYLI